MSEFRERTLMNIKRAPGGLVEASTAIAHLPLKYTPDAFSLKLQIKEAEQKEMFEIIEEDDNQQVIAARIEFSAVPVLISRRNLNQSTTDKVEFYRRLNRELDILQSISHPNIVHFVEYFYPNDRFLYIVTERMHLTLAEYFRDISASNSSVPHPFISALFAQLLRGISYLHLRNVMHRNLTPKNVLFNPHGFLIKISNFRCAGYVDREEDQMMSIGTVDYQAPEVYYPAKLKRTIGYDGRVDLWSIATIITEMVYGKKLFHPRNNLRLDVGREVQILRFAVTGLPKHKYSDTFGEAFDSFSPQKARPLEHFLNPSKITGEILEMGCTNENLFELLTNLFKIDPNERMTAQDSLKQPYVRAMSEKFAETFGECGDAAERFHIKMTSRMKFWT